jgi:hypothetical protein
MPGPTRRLKTLDYKTVRYPGHAAKIRMLRELGLLEKEPIRVDDVSVAPRAVFAAATVGQAAGLGVVVAFYLAIHWGLELPPIVGALAFSALATSLPLRLISMIGELPLPST